MRIRLTSEDITTLGVDAVVNAANGRLQGGGGVDGALHRAAGPQLAGAGRAHVERHGPLPVGEVFVSDGYRLPARWVLHTVGPVWDADRPEEMRSRLAACYRGCLDAAERIGARTVAFPNISTGVFGYPKGRAVDVVAGVIEERDRDLDEVVFCLFDPENRALYEAHPAFADAER
jgi:O-acetyl-ADP-ribose deacetylase (regulator of RNase III)